MSDSNPKPTHAPDPIRAYTEWSEHRYDPGHYLGGNLAPHLDIARLGRLARRKAGLWLGLIAFMTAMTVVIEWAHSGLFERAGWLALLALVSAAAIRMFRA